MRNPHYLLAIPLSLLVGLLWWSQKKERWQHSVRTIAEQAYKQTEKKELNAPPEIVLKKGDFHFFGKSHTCHVTANESRIFPEAKKTECIDVVCTIKDLATLRARKAYINQNDKIVFFPGTITETFQGWNGTKEHAIYNAKKQVITAHKTTIESPQHNVATRADKSIIDIKNETIALHGNVITTLTQEKK